MLKAEEEAKQLRDDYVSVEHVLLAIAEEDGHRRRQAVPAVQNQPRPDSAGPDRGAWPPAGDHPLILRAPTRRWRSTARDWLKEVEKGKLDP
ncbi:MAG: Clp protease N-terminal domain-containing protein [Syntrophotaleaceae bacterium]